MRGEESDTITRPALTSVLERYGMLAMLEPSAFVDPLQMSLEEREKQQGGTDGPEAADGGGGEEGMSLKKAAKLGAAAAKLMSGRRSMTMTKDKMGPKSGMLPTLAEKPQYAPPETARASPDHA